MLCVVGKIESIFIVFILLHLVDKTNRMSDKNDFLSLRFNEVQWKAAHNSVERRESIFEQLDIKIGKCGAIELDFVVDPTSVKVLHAEEEVHKEDAREDLPSKIEKLEKEIEHKDKEKEKEKEDKEKEDKEKETEKEKEKEKEYKGWAFGIQHEEKYNKKSERMEAIMRAIREWSNKHEGHNGVTIHLDLKQGATHGDHLLFVHQLDSAILWGLGRDKIFTPADLQKDSPDLLSSIRSHGWPTLKELQNKFILVISGSDKEEKVKERRETYCKTEPKKRMCFVDIDQRGCIPQNQNSNISHPHYQKGDRVFVNIQLGNKDWKKLGLDAYEQGFISRVWKANNEKDWKASLNAKIHFIATDKICNHPWAFITSNYVPLYN